MLLTRSAKIGLVNTKTSSRVCNFLSKENTWMDSTAYQLLSVGLSLENLSTDLTLILSLDQDWRLKIDRKQSFASGPSMREWVEHWTSTLDNFWHENHFTRLLTHDESLTSWEDEKYHIYILWHKRRSHLRWNWREVSSLVANRIMSNFCHIEKLQTLYWTFE